MAVINSTMFKYVHHKFWEGHCPVCTIDFGQCTVETPVSLPARESRETCCEFCNKPFIQTVTRKLVSLPVQAGARTA